MSDTTIRELERHAATGGLEDTLRLERARERTRDRLAGLSAEDVLAIARGAWPSCLVQAPDPHRTRAAARARVRREWSTRPLALLALLRDRDATRAALGIERLPAGAGQIEALQAERSSQRDAEELTGAERLRLKLEQRREQGAEAKRLRLVRLVLTAYARCDYRRSESSWAGGDHTVVVTICESGASCDGGSERVWSDNRKWRGTDSWASLTVPQTWARRVPQAIRVVSERLTLNARRCKPARGATRSWLVTRAQQGRGVEIYAQRGRIDLSAGGETRFVVVK